MSVTEDVRKYPPADYGLEQLREVMLFWDLYRAPTTPPQSEHAEADPCEEALPLCVFTSMPQNEPFKCVLGKLAIHNPDDTLTTLRLLPDDRVHREIVSVDGHEVAYDFIANDAEARSILHAIRDVVQI